MCGRFSQSDRYDDLAERFGAEADAELPPGKYNVAPTDPTRIVVETDGRRRLTSAHWGFRPFWRGRARREPGWINAKAETAAESRAFGPALRQRRCVIPADAFYEWDRGPRPPQPYAIGPTTGELFAFAGIWTDASHGDPATAAILTIGAKATSSSCRRLPSSRPLVSCRRSSTQVPYQALRRLLGWWCGG